MKKTCLELWYCCVLRNNASPLKFDELGAFGGSKDFWNGRLPCALTRPLLIHKRAAPGLLTTDRPGKEEGLRMLRTSWG